MRIISETVQVFDQEFGRVTIKTNYGTFIRDFFFDAIEETIRLEDVDSVEKHLLWEFFEDEYLELDKRDHESLVRADFWFNKTCKKAQDEDRYFRVTCGGNQYAYNGVSESDF